MGSVQSSCNNVFCWPQQALRKFVCEGTVLDRAGSGRQGVAIATHSQNVICMRFHGEDSGERDVPLAGVAQVLSLCVLQGPGWEAQCSADAEHLLGTLHSLPLDPNYRVSNVERLAAFCATRVVNIPAAPSSHQVRGSNPSLGMRQG